jgi:hypothetical protein
VRAGTGCLAVVDYHKKIQAVGRVSELRELVDTAEDLRNRDQWELVGVAHNNLMRGTTTDGQEPRAEVALGQTPPGAPDLREPQAGSLAGGRGHGDEPEIDGEIASNDGNQRRPSAGPYEPGRGEASDVPVPAQRIGNQPSQPGIVQRRHVHSIATRVHAPRGGDGLVEPVRVAVGDLQHDRQQLLHPGLATGARRFKPGPGNLEHGSRIAVQKRGALPGGGVRWHQSEHGRSRAPDRQSVHRAAVAEREVPGRVPERRPRRVGNRTRAGMMVQGLQTDPDAPGTGLRDARAVVHGSRRVRSEAVEAMTTQGRKRRAGRVQFSGHPHRAPSELDAAERLRELPKHRARNPFQPQSQTRKYTLISVISGPTIRAQRRLTTQQP